jgi:hypothetical protein
MTNEKQLRIALSTEYNPIQVVPYFKGNSSRWMDLPDGSPARSPRKRIGGRFLWISRSNNYLRLSKN